MTTERSPQRADGWTAAVRQRLGLGRLLPLGGAVDGAWIAETAAASVLRGAAVEGAVLGTLRIGPAREATGVDTGAETGRSAGAGGPAGAGVVAETGLALPPAPPSGLPPGPLRIEAEFRAAGDRPLPDSAAALRAALVTAAAARLGLEIAEVDLRVTALLDDAAPDQVTDPADAPSPPAPAPVAKTDTKAEGPAGEAAAAVPGVVSLTRVLGGAVHTAEDHIRVEVATAGDHRALDVARSVRTAVSAATADRLPVSVLVTDVVEASGDTR
ncbi:MULTISPECIES: hypothetical protein [Streptomyces]|uniref:hypothetical protein n=1 Tax=Streptomyces TaxID=1883 RepID=UPI000978F893|nr:MULTISPECIES: hypothetical protein [unclassified Streptomyces]ONI51529.1 hypothetical protein STIB_45780 [Streptomyces sp. IB2014 011-1]RDV49186.1 hypothetical protein DDV98_23260 [Streptomyces sp. IB2014 011-12]